MDNKPVTNAKSTANPSRPKATVAATPAKPLQPVVIPTSTAVAPAIPGKITPPAPATAPRIVVPEKRQVTLEFYHGSARAVHVAGSFNSWDPHVTGLQSARPGKWEVCLNLPPGKYEYKFVVDGQWVEDPLAKTTVPNPFGGVNSVLIVK